MIEISLLPGRTPQRWALRTLITRFSNLWRGVDGHMVGIEIAGDAARACWTRRKSGGIECVAFEEVPLPPAVIVDNMIMDSEVVSGALMEIKARLAERGLPKQARAAIGIAGHSIIIKKIALPTMSDEELRESIPWEAEQYIPFDINDVWIDAQVLNSHARKLGLREVEVLLVAAKRDLVKDYADAVLEAGFVPAIVDVNCFALENAFGRLYPQLTGAPAALVNIGADTININILANGVTALTRDILLGGELYVEEIQKQLNISYDEAHALLLQSYGSERSEDSAPLTEADQTIRSVNNVLVTQLRQSLDLYCATTADDHLSRIYLSGTGAAIPGLAKAIARQSGVSVEFFMFPAGVRELTVQRLELYSEGGAARFVIPYGLALRDMRKVRWCPSIGKEEPESRGGRRRSDGAPKRRQDEQKPVQRYRPSSKEIVQFCDLLALLLERYIPLVRALELLATPDVVVGGMSKDFRSALAVISENIKGGATLAKAMDEAFTGIPVITTMIGAGEEHQELIIALKRIGERF